MYINIKTKYQISKIKYWILGSNTKHQVPSIKYQILTILS